VPFVVRPCGHGTRLADDESTRQRRRSRVERSPRWSRWLLLDINTRQLAMIADLHRALAPSEKTITPPEPVAPGA
jgi:hypothetical protein